MRLKNSSWCIIFLFVSLALFGWLESGPTLSDPDSFYHARLVQLVGHSGPVLQFPWQQATILKDYFTDHHLLYHLILSPLTIFFEPIIALKIGSVILNSVFILLFAGYLFSKKIRHVWLYILLLLTAAPFLLRLSSPKASPLALIFLLLGIYFIEKKNYLFLFLVSGLYVWAHGGFILLLIAAFILDFKNLKSFFIIFSGFIAGLIINPYFPQNLLFYWQQVIQIGLINYKDKIEVGAEWYKYSLPDLVGNTHILLIIVALAAVVFFVFFKKQNPSIKRWGVFVLFLFLATWRSRRFIEYLIPVILIWSSLVMTWFLNSIYFAKQYQLFLDSWHKKKIWWQIFFLYLIILLPLGVLKGTIAVKEELERGIPVTQFSNALTYLKDFTPTASTVFNPQWDEWPIMFYNNQSNYYLVGLDPTFMYKYNPDLYQKYQDIITGNINSGLSTIIKQEFKSKYIFINNQDTKLNLFHTYLKRDKNIKLIYNDAEANVYQIIN